MAVAVGGSLARMGLHFNWQLRRDEVLLHALAVRRFFASFSILTVNPRPYVVKPMQAARLLAGILINIAPFHAGLRPWLQRLLVSRLCACVSLHRADGERDGISSHKDRLALVSMGTGSTRQA
jgi:hypothetical protein